MRKKMIVDKLREDLGYGEKMKVKITGFEIDHDLIKRLYRDPSQKLVGKTIDVEVDGSEDEDDLYSIVISEIIREMIDDYEWIWCGVGRLDYEVVEENKND